MCSACSTGGRPGSPPSMHRVKQVRQGYAVRTSRVMFNWHTQEGPFQVDAECNWDTDYQKQQSIVDLAVWCIVYALAAQCDLPGVEFWSLLPVSQCGEPSLKDFALEHPHTTDRGCQSCRRCKPMHNCAAPLSSNGPSLARNTDVKMD